MNILVLPGDGIGPEITAAAMQVLMAVDKAFSLELAVEQADIGFTTLNRLGTTLPADVLEKARRSDGIILGPISHMDYPARDQGGVNVSAALRIGLDLYANIRPARCRPGLSKTGADMDLVIMRENTEGFYADRNMFAGSGEFMPTAEVALSVRKITAFACSRIARRSFEMACRRRKKVTAVHKANNLILTDGLFLREVRKVAREFPDVVLEEVLVDAMAALLVRRPDTFDVVVTTNLYGDILSDLASELSGSIGLAGSLNAGDGSAAAQAQHGSAPEIAGKDQANPTSLILSTAMLLSWLGERSGRENLVAAGRAVDRSVDITLQHPGHRTKDLGGSLGTREFAEAVVGSIPE
ncbi:MAG: 3-isopropylmalate dehydrogenase [Deltaproteobacteria bacterium SG8_13]|nr:MAG: 3-isopropylmalate dehydrogenase [Deltaproteobacteria bacterium SG8_13]